MAIKRFPSRGFPFRVSSLSASLSAALAGALLSPTASSQTTSNCTITSSGVSCSASGNTTSTIRMSNTSTGGNPAPSMQATSTANVTATIDSSTKAALEILATGADGDSSGDSTSSLTGTDTQGITATNSGNLTLQAPTGGPLLIQGTFYGLFSKMEGGAAASSSNGEYGGNGGVAGRSGSQILSLTNQGNITLDLPNVTVESGAALAAFSQGGIGGSTTEDHEPGGAGGQSVGASIFNTGNITVNLSGTGMYAGILASSGGGKGAEQYDGGKNAGGGSGNVVVQNAGNVALNWTWADNSTGGAALYGILAQSEAGHGGATTTNGLGNGGAGGAGYASTLSAAVTLQSGGAVSVNQTGAPPAAGAGVAAIVIGGNGGNAMANVDGVLGGNAGNAGAINGSQPAVQITNIDTSVSTTGTRLPALLLLARGGSGGGTFNSSSQSDRNGGSGGQAGDANLKITAASKTIALSTTGHKASGIQTLQVGGAGGNGGDYGGDLVGVSDSNAGNAGVGGDTGLLNLQTAGSASLPISISTSGTDSPGINAVLQGGQGGNGGTLYANLGGGGGGNGGAGGSTGALNVALTGTQITTTGTNAYGVLAQNLGANGGDGGSSHQTIAFGSAGGKGGATGAVNITQDTNSSIITHGQSAVGIVAQTASGSGGNAGVANGEISGTSGVGGAGGAAGAVDVTNNGTVATHGVDAIGILAQSLAGGGGGGAANYGIIDSKGGQGGSAGSSGDVTVSNAGTISTSGDFGLGIVAQSVGGSGGVAGSASGLGVSIGGDKDSNPFLSDANGVHINGLAAGSVTTSGVSAIGILAQSIGGGGGVGGASEGLVSIGETGGLGGSGGSVTASLDSFLISTGGDNAHGLVAQSIGGGGGSAGNASSLGLFTSVAIGQSAGSGGTGGGVTANLNNANIVTQGSKTAGLVAQSIGGGGGVGGQAFAYSIAPLITTAVAIGGQGGTGGNGAVVSSQLIGGSIKTGQAQPLLTGCSTPPCAGMNAQPVDAHGVIIQSIGAGGGLGGNASAKAAAIAVPVTPSGSQVSVSASFALGAAGGIAGDGDYVTFAASQGAQIETRGQGAHGVLIQSIGGGGGAGGDSSTLAAALGYGGSAPEGAESISVDASIALGANGGGGGSGGSVWTAVGGVINVSGGSATFIADASGTTPSQMLTYGDYANGITAQSIGGGGGNAGFGSSNTQAFGTGTNAALSVGFGGVGDGGGHGGLVQVEVLPTGVVQTFGSGAIGVLAQSIGGGGGTSQGGSISLAGASSHAGSQLKIDVGREGGGGGTGGKVDVLVSGAISTAGSDAPGVQAQSIGGGGGQGGSAGADASADNPIISALDGRVGVKDVLQDIYKKLIGEAPANYKFTLDASISIGGEGGSGNQGGLVDVTLDSGGTIVTAGDWSSGIFAQSVGGGGGKGGSALATGTGWADPTHFDLNANLAVGGNGGTGADGGNVTTTLGNGSITTEGFSATGIFAQSVGGGGGHAADGSDGFFGTLAVGIASGGAGGGGGSGGTVNLNTTANSNTTVSNAAVIQTSGEAAFGVMLQSVGGGGGFAGAGTSARIAVADDPIPAIKLSSGGITNANQGSGGNVTLQDNGQLMISTSGNNAFGVLAQSIGGGGGTLVNSQNQQATTGIVTGLYGSLESPVNNYGGVVTVNLGSSSVVQTSGTGAHGLVAQSVGGGGGIVGLPGTAATLTVDLSQAGDVSPGLGAGGNVNITNNGIITVKGAGAIGILAQSVNNGGGLILAADGQTVFAGSTEKTIGAAGSNSVRITVSEGASVSATGANGIGIFAQNTNGSGVFGTIDGTVLGGAGGAGAGTGTSNGTGAGASTGTGYGIWVDSAFDSALTVGSTGSITAGGDVAIQATSGKLNVTNNGTVTGSVVLNGGAMTNAGTYVAGAVFEGAELNNNGLIALGSTDSALPGYARTRFATTTLNGALVQSANGVLQVGADFNTLESDALVVNGPANLDGVVHVAPRALLPNRELAVLTVNGAQTGAITASDSPVFDYESRQTGNITRVRVANADFNAGAMQLTANAARVANFLQSDWDRGGSPAHSSLYAVLDSASRSGANAYQDRVSDLSPGVALAPAVQMQVGLSRFTGAMMSCPAFMGDASLMKERNCAWGQVTAVRSNQDGGNGSSGFSYDNQTYQFGGQRAIAPHWFLGGSFAYENAKLRGDDRRVSGSGDLGYAGLVLKREVGPWTFSGALGGGYGSYDLNRNLNIPNYQNTAKSSPDVYSVGTRLRAARSFTHGNVYLKPYVDLDATYSRMPSYIESGDALSLAVDRSDQVVFALAPTLEVGGRVELPRGAVMRPFAYAGVSFLSENDWKTKARLSGASTDAESFTTSMPTDNVIGRVGFGIQVMNINSVDFRVQYDGEFASRRTSHSASLKLVVPF